MKVRTATAADAPAIADIYSPIVTSTAVSFELEPPTIAEMTVRILSTLERLPWLVALDADDTVKGYVYASRHRERAAYQWSVDVTAYVHADARGTGVGKTLYQALFKELTALGYHQAFAGIALPNPASIALHEAMGFEPLGIYRKVGFKLGAWHDVGWWQKALRTAEEFPVPPTAFAARR